MSWTHKSRPSQKPWFNGQHAFEHWYRDNQVYFITARCKNRSPVFASENAKQIFWDKFDHYTKQHGFFPWVTSLMDNHSHTLGYLRVGLQLGPMMQKLHGSVAKLVNDTLPIRVRPFWIEKGKQGYFDGCIRDEIQCQRAYRYVLTQSVRHCICAHWQEYPHTRKYLELKSALQRATELQAFLRDVPYRRYAKR